MIVIDKTSKVDYCEILSRNVELINRLYALGKELIFKKCPGGIINPPVLVYVDRKEIPTAVFKVVIGEVSVQAMRLSVLEELKSRGCTHVPKIYKAEGKHIAEIEGHLFYLIQFLKADPTPLSTKLFLEATGQLHLHAKNISFRPQESKWEEFKARSAVFLDPWFQGHDLFKDDFWKRVVKRSEYFASEEFGSLYRTLPAHLIHGDNNQTNVILSDKTLYFIDFDSLRIDIRLLDLATYFRYGGFEDYLALKGSGELISQVNAAYGALTKEEEVHFYLIMEFTHIEFLSFALGVFKKAVTRENKTQAEEFHGYISLYKDQMLKMILKGRYVETPFRVEETLESREETKGKKCLDLFLAKGGKLQGKIALLPEDKVYPSCAAGFNRSQTLHALLSPYSHLITLFPPHATTLGFDPYNDRPNWRATFEMDKVPPPGFAKWAGHERVTRFGYDHFRTLIEEENPSQGTLEAIRSYFDAHYFGPEASGKRRVYITFAQNTHVILHRLNQTNQDLSRVVVVSLDLDDTIGNPYDPSVKRNSEEAHALFARTLLSYLIVDDLK